ncbi:MAG TPA: tetratricopeptide repeat protein [Sandaracinaceae bacterium LLY-WYZ-13_1]|nr:tetratricopeptide repeat protein [Sandaracinaceae bacterium LLY-WYZ-13_1]
MLNDPNEPMSQLSAHLDRGWDLVARGDLAGARLSAEKSLELDEESPEAHNLAAYVLQAEGRPEEALEHYRQALDLDESYVDAMLNAADVLIHPLQDFDGALTLIREALEWLGEDEIDERTDAMLLELDVHLHRGDREAAAQLVRQLPDGPFDNPALLLQVGRAHLDVGDVERAEPLLDEAIEQGPPNADAHYYRALAYEIRGDAQGTLLSFLQARELDATTPPPPWSLPPEQFERRVQSALRQLSAPLSKALEGALVVITDQPGAEVVADGLDPRMPVLLDAMSETSPPTVGRLFVYRRNVERVAVGLLEVEAEVVRALETELGATLGEAHDSAGRAPSGDAEP